MKVKELIKWLEDFEDQDAEVIVVEHHDSSNYEMQGGYVYKVPFISNIHSEYINFKGEKWVKKDSTNYNKSFLFLGAINL